MNIVRPQGVDFVPLQARDFGPAYDRSSAVIGVERIGSEYWRLRFQSWPELTTCRPGQFVMLRPEAERHLLRRPFTVFHTDAARGEAQVVFRVTGRGTAALAALRQGDRLSVLGPLGNGFEVEAGTRKAIVVGRGVGFASLNKLARHCLDLEMPTHVLLSARRPGLWLCSDEFREAGANVITVDDRSGNSALDQVGQQIEPLMSVGGAECFVCGSSRLISLLTRLGNRHAVPVQAALEAPMACGVGTCHACPLEPGTETEGALVCVDGPVFTARQARRLA